MPRRTVPLSPTQVASAKAKAKEYNLMDGGGLKLRVKPNGLKTWLFNYTRPHTKKRANQTLGTYPQLSLQDARLRAQESQAQLAKDIDPQEYEKQQSRIEADKYSNTLKAVAAKWIAVKKSKVTPDYAEDIWRSLENHIFKELGKLPITQIKARMVINTLEKTAAKGSLETVKRLSQRLNEIMIFAVHSEYIEANPLAGIGKAFKSPAKEKMATLKPEELPELMLALSQASIKITTRCVIEWQLHTMTRPSEAAGARWEEIDLRASLWTIPAERMKKKRHHSIPLTKQMINLLEVMRPISGGREFIFPADRNPRNPTNSQTANMALKRMGFANRLVAHGLRALASTTLNEQGFDPDVIEAALSHSDSNEVRAAYNRAEYLERRRKMMTWWSNHIDEAASGNLSLAAGRKGIRIIENM